MRRSATLALLAGLAIAGCGGSSHSSASAGASPATVTRTVTRGASSSTSSTTSATTQSATVTSTSSRSSATGPAGAVVCRASGLAVTFLGGQGATGHGLLGFQIRNTGSSPCSTVGYPGVQFLAKSGAALPTHPSHTTSDFFGQTVKRALTLSPGQTASFRLGVTHVSSSPNSDGCTTVAAVAVIAPNDTTPVNVSIPGGAYECAGTVTVSPMQPGDDAYH